MQDVWTHAKNGAGALVNIILYQCYRQQQVWTRLWHHRQQVAKELDYWPKLWPEGATLLHVSDLFNYDHLDEATIGESLEDGPPCLACCQTRTNEQVNDNMAHLNAVFDEPFQ